MQYEFESFKPEISNPVESLHFEIGDPRIIFDMICNRIYSAPLQTSIQEYMCNARDSHREAGIPNRSIKVVLPSKLDPAIHIRDFGMGISPERMKNVFVRIGESTKRADNTQTGGFGVGAKSAFSYTDNFTIKTAFDGKERTYLAYIGDNGLGDMDLLEEKLTDEKNFTDISFVIAPEDKGHLEPIISRVALFWPVPPIVIGSSFESFDDSLMTPRLLQGGEGWGYFDLPEMADTSEWRKPFMACCDGVIYPLNIPGEFTDMFGSHRKDRETMIFFFEVGEVDLAITRETLQYTNKTQKVVEARCRSLIEVHKNQIESIMQKDLKEALPTIRDLIKQTPYIHSLKIKLKDGVSVKVNGTDAQIDLYIDGIQMDSILTREHSIEPDMVKCEKITRGIKINYNHTMVVNDKNLVRIPGARIRGVQESVNSTASRIDIITLPVTARDFRESYQRDVVSYADFLYKVVPVLEMLGLPMISSFKNSTTARMTPSEVYLDRSRQRYGRRDKERVSVDELEETEEWIVFPEDDPYSTMHYQFVELVSLYRSCQQNKGPEYCFYYATTKRARKIVDSLDIYDRYQTLWNKVAHFMRSLHAMTFESYIFQEETTRAVKQIPNMLSALHPYKDQLPAEFAIPMTKIMEAHQMITDKKSHIRSIRETYGPERVPPESSHNRFIRFIESSHEKNRRVFGSLMRRINRARKETADVSQQVNVMREKLKTDFPLVFASASTDTGIIENDVIPYIKIKSEGVLRK